MKSPPFCAIINLLDTWKGAFLWVEKIPQKI